MSKLMPEERAGVMESTERLEVEGPHVIMGTPVEMVQMGGMEPMALTWHFLLKYSNWAPLYSMHQAVKEDMVAAEAREGTAARLIATDAMVVKVEMAVRAAMEDMAETAARFISR
jgi:hypothetical protein